MPDRAGQLSDGGLAHWHHHHFFIWSCCHPQSVSITTAYGFSIYDSPLRGRQTCSLQWARKRWSLCWVCVLATKESFSRGLPPLRPQLVSIGPMLCPSCKLSHGLCLPFSASKLGSGLCRERWTALGDLGCRVNNPTQICHTYPLWGGKINYPFAEFQLNGVRPSHLLTLWLYPWFISMSVFSPSVSCIFWSYPLATSLATNLPPESVKLHTFLCWWKFLRAADFGQAVTNSLTSGDFIFH